MPSHANPEALRAGLGLGPDDLLALARQVVAGANRAVQWGEEARDIRFARRWLAAEDEVARLRAEAAATRLQLTGHEKALALMYAGMESVVERYDELKHENRRLQHAEGEHD